MHPLPPSSDHHPLGVTLNTSIGNDDTPAKAVICEDYVFPVFNWRRAQDNSINLYKHKTQVHHSNISIPDVCKCTEITCSINEHTDELTTMYENICVALRNSIKQYNPEM